MHASHYSAISFFYNGDYSGLIKVNTDDYERELTFKELATVVFLDSADSFWTEAQREGLKTFVAEAIINEGISRLEQMEPDVALRNPWLGTLLREMMK